jgi:hypothetical protein
VVIFDLCQKKVFWTLNKELSSGEVASLRSITGEGTAYISIYQLLITQRSQAVPSFYNTEKGGEEVQTVVNLPATTFIKTKLLKLAESHG